MAKPLVVILGATASGKTALSLALAQHFHGEILSCDSVAVYRELEIGTAKPSPAERALIPHHLIDIADPTEPCTAGDYSRLARTALTAISARNRLPIIAGGTGLYLRALIDGLSPAPQRNPALRQRLHACAATRGPQHLHRILSRLDPEAARRIHPNDIPKAIRAIEVSLAARTPITQQWTTHTREALTGYRILRLGLDPPRDELYRRINQRAAAMFAHGLIEETRALLARYGPACQPLRSLGYAEAAAAVRNELTLEQAIDRAQQGHRNYAKRQLTWFRREPNVLWLKSCGDAPDTIAQAIAATQQFLQQEPPDPGAPKA